MKRFFLSAPLVALAIACGGDKAVPTVDSTAAPAPSVRAAPSATAALPPSQVAKVEYQEADFVESERNRDPFRSFVAGILEAAKRPVESQRKVLLGQHAIDELKLVAIITGGDYPRAMVLDPAGKGWVLKKGDFLGRPEVVHVGGANGADYQVNWRVDRVRPGDLVLVREDPAQPGATPATRIIPLHPEGAAEKIDQD